MKKIPLLVFFICALYVCAQNPQKLSETDAPWRFMLRAQTAFEQKNYSEAIKQAVLAKNMRKKQTEWAVFSLEQSLKPIEVQRAGENINDVLETLNRREEYEVVEIIENVIKKMPAQKEPFTVIQVKEAVASSLLYPEADFLLGTLYALQGEYSLAENYLNDAWKNASKLDIPDQKYDILYQMAALAALQKKFDVYEKTLLLVINETDKNAAGIESPFARSVKQALLRGTTLDRFFLLYRHEFFVLVSAYNQLAEYYYNNKEYSRSLSYSALGVLSSFTRLYQAIKERDIDYTFTTFSDFQKKVSKYYDIAQWSVSQEIWKAFYNFSMILRENGQTAFSHEILISLAADCPEEYWRRRAFMETFNTN